MMWDNWIILGVSVILHMLRYSIIAMSPILGSPPLFFRLSVKANTKGILVTRVATRQVQPGDFVSPIPTNMPVFFILHIPYNIPYVLVLIRN